MNQQEFPSWPDFSQEEIDAAARVLQSGRVNYWTGEETRLFEHEFANWSSCTNAVALGNGTQALEAALRALKIGPGDEVVVTPRTFFASASCIATVGAIPVFADVDPDSQNITARSIESVVSPRTRAIIAVHLAGWPCEMDDILSIADSNKLFVVEDCAQAHGARFKGKSVGSLGHIGAWSFCQDKIITTGGEGGMVTTSNREFWERMWSYKDHGKSWEAVYEREHSDGFRWTHESFGTNWRMLELQATIGRIQLRRMRDWHRERAKNAAHLIDSISGCPGLRVPTPPTYIDHAWYRFYAFVIPHALKSGWDRHRVISEINACGVPCYSGSCPEVYLERAFKGTGWQPNERLPVARELGETSLALLVHPTLGEAEMTRTSDAIQSTMARAVR